MTAASTDDTSTDDTSTDDTSTDDTIPDTAASTVEFVSATNYSGGSELRPASVNIDLGAYRNWVRTLESAGFDYTLNGIANGMIYAVLALALVLIYRATRIINFAQGAAGMMTTEHGTNITDGGAPFYEVYECADGGWIAIGAVEKSRQQP